MPLVNSLLVRHSAGHSVFFRQSSANVHGYREGFVTLGELSKGQSEVVAEAMFDRIAEPATAYLAEFTPVGSDVPYEDFTVGDTITVPDRDGNAAEVKVMALSVRANPLTGRPEYVPELNLLAQEVAERHEEWLKRMANGALRGTIGSAQPFGQQPETANKVPPAPEVIFNRPGLLSLYEGTSSDVWPLLRSTQVTLWVAALVGVGTTDTEVDVVRNGITIGTITIPAGELWGTADITVGLTPPDDQLWVTLVTAGDGAVGLTVAGYREAI